MGVNMCGKWGFLVLNNIFSLQTLLSSVVKKKNQKSYSDRNTIIYEATVFQNKPG